MKFMKAREGTRDPATGDLYVNGEIGVTLLAGAANTRQLDICSVDQDERGARGALLKED